MCVGCRKVVIVEANRLCGYGFHHDRCTDLVTVEDNNVPVTSVCSRRILPCRYTDKKYIKTLNTQRYEVSYENNLKIFGDKTYSVDVEGSLINACDVGETVDIVAIVKTRGTKVRSKLRKFGFYALNFETQVKVEITGDLDSNIQHRLIAAWIHDMNSNDKSELITRNDIISNAFPHHYGSNAIKLAILLTICSGCGLSKNEKNKEIEKRDVFHLMLAGQMNAGKRKLLKMAADLCLKSNEVTSYGLSITSLTARAFKVKKREACNIEAGVLMRANEGISCFYEFNMLKKKFRQILHEIMESQRMKITTGMFFFSSHLTSHLFILYFYNSKTED